MFLFGFRPSTVLVYAALLGLLGAWEACRNETANAVPPAAPAPKHLPDSWLPEDGKPPQGAIVLYSADVAPRFVNMSGKELNWPAERGALVSTANGRRSNHAISRLLFRDAQVHLEFQLPVEGDGNSGVYFQGLYEIQILNSTGKRKLGDGDIGAIYNLQPPRMNAALPPGEWQTLDVRFRPPRRDGGGKIIKPGSLTAVLNGKLIQDETELLEPKSPYNPFRYDTTPYLKEIWRNYTKTGTGPLVLQDHDNPVRFRNVWINPLDDLAAEFASAPH